MSDGAHDNQYACLHQEDSKPGSVSSELRYLLSVMIQRLDENNLLGSIPFADANARQVVRAVQKQEEALEGYATGKWAKEALTFKRTT